MEKWRNTTKGIIDVVRRENIEKLVLDFGNMDNVTCLGEALAGLTKNSIA